MADSIGDESFVLLSGQIDDPSDQVEVIQRPGVDGVAFRLMGNHPSPFELVSLEDFSSLSGARDAMIAYKALKGGDPVDLVWQDVTPDDQVKVIDVVQHELRAATCIIGGVNLANGSTGFLLRARWTLIFVND